LQGEDTDAEVFFNYDPKGGQAEFAEKDEDYREEMIAYLATALRDGPLPERTPENDPTLTLDGPRVTDWKRIASPDASCKFSPDSRSLVISESEGGRSRIYLLAVAEPSERKLLAEFEGSAAAEGFVRGAQSRLLVTERLPAKRNESSSNDKKRLWLVNDTGKQELKISGAITNWYLNEQCISPDGRFIVIHSWREGSQRDRARVLHVCEIELAQWRTVERPGIVLGVAGWRADKPIARVVTGTEFDNNKPRQVFQLEVETGQLLLVPPSQPDSRPGFVLSPARTRGFELRGSDALRIIELKTNLPREFPFHAYDRRSVQQEGLKWANDRYIIFQTSRRTELIDSDTMKMNFPTENDLKTYCEFSPDFTLALGHKDDGMYLGRVIPRPRADVVRRAIEACRLEARKPAGVRLGGGGDAV
jgi:hypothetical protein